VEARRTSFTRRAALRATRFRAARIASGRFDELAGEPRLRGYHPYLAARVDLLQRLGRFPEAAAAYREALDLAGTEPERAHLRRRLSEVEPSGPDG
jgi:predicted RNA polymerase sigma factor